MIKNILLFLFVLCSLGALSQRVDQYDSITTVTDDMYFWVLDPNSNPQSHRISVYRLDQRYIQNGQILSVSEMDVTTELTATLAVIDSAYFSKLVADSAVVNRFVLSSDPGADRILFWDESSDSTDYLTAGSGLTITGTTLTADVTLTGSETLTNKTLTSPVIATITNSGGDITLTPNAANHVNISAGGLEIGGTEVISSSRTLTNIVSGSGAFYETGTFTPEVSDAATAGNTATGTFSGFYIKTGSFVHVQITLTNIATAGMTAGNDLFIRNLPFSSSGSYFSNGGIRAEQLTFTGNISPETSGGSYLRISETVSATNVDYVTVGEVSTGVTDIAITIDYYTE